MPLFPPRHSSITVPQSCGHCSCPNTCTAQDRPSLCALPPKCSGLAFSIPLVFHVHAEPGDPGRWTEPIHPHMLVCPCLPPVWQGYARACWWHLELGKCQEATNVSEESSDVQTLHTGRQSCPSCTSQPGCSLPSLGWMPDWAQPLPSSLSQIPAEQPTEMPA